VAEGGKQIRLCRCGTRLARDNSGLLCSMCERSSRGALASAPSVTPEFWLTDDMQRAFANRHIGQIIYAYRVHPWHGRAISQAVVAGWAGISQTQLSRIESGRPVRDLERLMHWVRILRIPSRLLWFELDEPDGSDDLLSEGVNRFFVGPAGEVSQTRRRDFIAAGSLAVGQVIQGLEHELDLMHMTLDRGTSSEERVTYIERMASDFGVQVVKFPPLALIDPTLRTLRSIRVLLEERQTTRQQARLVRASAMICTIAGEIMFNVGQFKKADDWYKTAQHAAYDVGDRYLLDIALAGQAYLPTYSGDPRGVLALLGTRLESGAKASPALAWLWGFKARAHAALGQDYEFERSIAEAHEMLARSDAELIGPGIFSFVPEKLAFYEATGSVQLRKPESALLATDRALSLYDPSETTEPALTKLERASAFAQASEVEEGCRIATEALTNPRVFHGITVRSYALKFDSMIRGVQSPATRHWREVRAEVHNAETARSRKNGIS